MRLRRREVSARGSRGQGASTRGAPARLTSGPRNPKRQSFDELRALQRLALKAITRPLAPGDRMQRTWEDGRPTREVVEAFIKPNDRVTSIERLEIYNKQYWFRVLDCLHDDYPGLRAVLGERKFNRLRIAYLTRYPSRSFTLRNLGLQPYITLLELGYPLDDYVLAVKRRDTSLRTEASNAIEQDGSSRKPSKRASVVRRPPPQKTWLAVHRHDNAIYYKRLAPEAYLILCALRDGRTLAQACAIAVERSDDPHGEWTGKIQDWFAGWTRFGWFCHRSGRGGIRGRNDS